MLQKTKVLTLIVFGLLFLNLSAQEDKFSNDATAKLPDEDRKFRFGLQFSPNISWFKANSTGHEGEGAKMGFSYGLSVEYFITNNYLFSTGIFILNAKGSLSNKLFYVDESSIYTADVETNYKPKYIELPIMLKLRTNEIGYLTYFSQFGFNTGFNFSSSSEAIYTYTKANDPFLTTTTVDTKDNSNEINWLNLALVIGGGVEYNISGNTSLFLGLTYNNGFLNQLDTKIPAFDSNGNVVVDSNNNPVLTEKEASANLNYIALNIGIYF